VQASEQERRRWARELHDETLQELAGLNVLLAGARRSADPARLDAAVGQALEIITGGIANLRALIADLRPASLDELGTAPAVESLVDRVRTQSGLDIELDIRLAYEDGRTPCRHVPEIESTMYRLVQEALSNIVKHAGAQRASIAIVDPEDDEGELCVEVTDDGAGFDPGEAMDGFGLIGMRERLALVHGELEVSSSAGGGTSLKARIPVQRRIGDEPPALAAKS
jgi:signal transduction histidine kinase